MGGGEVVHIERFTAGGGPALKVLAVPGRRPNLIRCMGLGLGRSTSLGRLRGNGYSCVFGPGALRPLGSSQANDYQNGRQSMSKESTHSFHLVFEKSYPRAISNECFKMLPRLDGAVNGKYRV